MWPYITIVIVVIILIAFYFVYNGFVKENNKVKESFVQPDVYLKKMWDYSEHC